MYNEQLEALISAALADGVLTEKEKQILFKKAQGMGIDLDEFEMVLDARLVELKKAEKKEAEKSAPKSTKYGDVRKCPVCGALVPALAGVCSECGYEFSGVDANLSSKVLAEKLSKVERRWGEDSKYIRAKQEVIETFPIPLTKSDLLEFITSLRPKTLDVTNKLSDAYWIKYSECIEKIRIVFPNDSQLAPCLKDYNSLKNQRRFKKVGFWFLAPLRLTLLISVVACLLVVYGIGFETDDDLILSTCLIIADVLVAGVILFFLFCRSLVD